MVSKLELREIEQELGRLLKQRLTSELTRRLYHAERQDMTDDEYARVEKAAERKRDAGEGFDD